MKIVPHGRKEIIPAWGIFMSRCENHTEQNRISSKKDKKIS